MSDGVTRILLAALGGEGGGVLMNWVVAAGRSAGHVVQATSVPGVAQRTGSTSYYIEVAPLNATDTVLGLVPLAGRVDALVSSELVETARALSQGYVSPDRTTVVSSTARFYSTAEKINMADGRYQSENIHAALENMARKRFLLDLGRLASDNNTFVSATMFGALAGSGALPWKAEVCRAVLDDERSMAGFNAALEAVQTLAEGGQLERENLPAGSSRFTHLPDGLREVVAHGAERTEDYQDTAYRALFLQRVDQLTAAANLKEQRVLEAATEAVRRLALWMAYEDIARVADLKTRPERFERIREEVQLEPGQLLTVTEFMKPRAEEVADILPAGIGRRVMAHAKRGGWFPFLGSGRYIKSNGIFGYRLLRLTASLKHIRRRSLRYAEEQAAIEEWLGLVQTTLTRSHDFAAGLAELPRVLKGYSDTLLRGKRAYQRIMEEIVRPAVAGGTENESALPLQNAISAALADDKHTNLDGLLGGPITTPEAPVLWKAPNA